jgi:hypothetical protein
MTDLIKWVFRSNESSGYFILFVVVVLFGIAEIIKAIKGKE